MIEIVRPLAGFPDRPSLRARPARRRRRWCATSARWSDPEPAASWSCPRRVLPRLLPRDRRRRSPPSSAIEDESDVLVLVVVTPGDTPEHATANLAGPGAGQPPHPARRPVRPRRPRSAHARPPVVGLGLLARIGWARGVGSPPAVSDRSDCMLVLSRRVGESLVIGDDIVVTILEVRGDVVRVGVDAPRTHPGAAAGAAHRGGRDEPGGRLPAGHRRRPGGAPRRPQERSPRRRRGSPTGPDARGADPAPDRRPRRPGTQRRRPRLPLHARRGRCGTPSSRTALVLRAPLSSAPCPPCRPWSSPGSTCEPCRPWSSPGSTCAWCRAWCRAW